MTLGKGKFVLGLFLSVFLCASLVLSVRADVKTWGKVYGGAGWDVARSVVEASDGGYAIAGYTNSFGAGGYDFWLIKANVDGDIEWNMLYGGMGNDAVFSLISTSDGGYALAGTTESFGAGGYDFWLIKVNAGGGVEWDMTYGDVGNEVACSVVEVSGGGYAIAGVCNYTEPVLGYYYDYAPDLSGDFWLVKTDSFGNLEWNMTYGDARHERANSLVATSDGGYALAGYTATSGGSSDFWLVKTDDFGSMEWNQTYSNEIDSKIYGEIHWNAACSLVVTSDGYAIAGYTAPFLYYNGVCWLVKTDELGNMEWNQTYDDGWGGVACSLVVTSDGGYALAGIWNFADYIDLENNNEVVKSGHFLLIKTDEFGTTLWNRTYGGGLIDCAYSVVNASDGGYVIAGVTGSFGTGNGDFWLIKTDEYGVVPEAAWVVLPLLATATFAILLSKKKRFRLRS